MLLYGCFSVSLDITGIDDLESSQLLYIRLVLFCAFATEVGAS
ncbi:Transposase for insertion sequence element IS231B [Bacillus thuringiensis serovar thuringiensis str. T01001]|nr:Transposase for insertion sequence element IS231B [Bacillus thuringiensis serovar thuringiensis str. T01001]EEM50382.1 Transposase for insertion sequence element IS231B [Bacillus thuringiensis serovar kurstaki str. T03a001]